MSQPPDIQRELPYIEGSKDRITVRELRLFSDSYSESEQSRSCIPVEESLYEESTYLETIIPFGVPDFCISPSCVERGPNPVIFSHFPQLVTHHEANPAQLHSRINASGLRTMKDTIYHESHSTSALLFPNYPRTLSSQQWLVDEDSPPYQQGRPSSSNSDAVKNTEQIAANASDSPE